MPLSKEKETNKNRTQESKRFMSGVKGQLVFSKHQHLCRLFSLSILEPSLFTNPPVISCSTFSLVCFEVSLPDYPVLLFTPADTAAPQAGAANLQLQAMHRALLSPHHAGRPDAEGEWPCPLPADRQGHKWEVGRTFFFAQLRNFLWTLSHIS